MFSRFLLAGECLSDRKFRITSNLCQAAEKKIKQDLQNRGSKMVCESLQVRLQDTTVDEKNGFAQICPLQICRKNVKPGVNMEH